MEWWMIIQVAVTQNHFFNLKRPFTIFKQAYQLNKKAMAWNFFQTLLPFIKSLIFWRIIELD